MKLTEKIFEAFYILNKNPALFKQFLAYRIKRLGKTWQKHYAGLQEIAIDKIHFQIDFDKLGSSLYAKQLYFKTYELHVVDILKKVLKHGSTFIDVGANLGYMSATAASLVGKKGHIVAFEPIPHVFEELKKIKALNPGYNIDLCNKAISEDNQSITMGCPAASDYGSSSAVHDFLTMNALNIKNKIVVDSTRLDDYFIQHKINTISLIKIDVEGFEFSALKSLEGYFLAFPNRPVIICEIAPSALHLLGLEVNAIFDYMAKFGYKAYDGYDLKTKIKAESVSRTKDVVFSCN